MRAILSTSRSYAARRGFTLIEILSVVVILGIVSAMIIPQLGTHDDSKVASAARAMMADIIYAQNSAVSKQQMFYVVFDKTNNKYDLASSVTPLTIITHPVTMNNYEQVFGVAPLDGVSMSSVSFDGKTTLGFDSLGVPYSVDLAGIKQTLNSGSVVVSAKNASLTVSVLPYSGEVKIQ